MANFNMDKKEIRNFIRQKKKEMSRTQIERAGALITENVFALPEYAAADVILSYMAVNQEVLTAPIIEQALKDGKTVGIPKTFGNRHMEFFAYDEGNLAAGFGGIPEPASSDAPLFFPPAAKILILVPGLAFGRDMNRIGYGGGFYDTYLENRPYITKAALGYDFQIFSSLPCEPHDIKMDLIITPREIIKNNCTG